MSVCGVDLKGPLAFGEMACGSYRSMSIVPLK